MRIAWRALRGRRAPNRWLAAGIPTLAVFGIGLILRIAFDSVTPSWLVWWAYGGLALIGLVLTAVGLVKAAGRR